MVDIQDMPKRYRQNHQTYVIHGTCLLSTCII